MIIPDTSFRPASVFAETDQCLAIRSWRLPGSELEVEDKAQYPRHPSLLFMHYFGGSSREWEFIAPQLATRDYICIAPDARGHGDSQPSEPSGPATGYSVSEMAEDARIVAEHMWLPTKPSGWVAVGHSMGGKAALQLAAGQPDGLRGLILIAPSPPTPQPMSEQERQEDLDRYGDVDAAVKTAKKIAATPLSLEAEAIFVDDNLRAAKSAWIAWDKRGSREDISAVMPRVTVPTLLITGSDDPVIAQYVYLREVAQRLPNLTDQLVIEGGGHLVTMTHPEPVSRKIASWVGALESV